MEILEEPVIKEEVEDTPEENRIKPCTKSCYSCGEEGHISQNCMNGDLVAFPTVEVEYDPQEIEALIGTKKSRKRNRLDSRINPISADKDLSHITCYRCKDLGHYADNVERRSQEPKGRTPSPRSLKTYRKLFVYAAGKQDTMLINVPTR